MKPSSPLVFCKLIFCNTETTLTAERNLCINLVKDYGNQGSEENKKSYCQGQTSHASNGDAICICSLSLN